MRTNLSECFLLENIRWGNELVLSWKHTNLTGRKVQGEEKKGRVNSHHKILILVLK